MSGNNPQVIFLKKIYSILTAQEGAVPSADPINSIYVAFCSPGIPMPKSALNFDITTKGGILNLAQWSHLVNTIPDVTSGVWTASSNKLNNIYDDFINGAESNLHELTDHEKDMHNKALSFLRITKTTHDPFDDTKINTTTTDSDAYSAYKKCRTAYKTGLMAYNSARLTALSSSDPVAKNTFAINAAILQDNITSSYDEWISSGYKEYVEEALDILANLSGKSFIAQLKEARINFDSNSLSDPILGKFYPTPPVPIQFFDDDGDSSWTTYKYDYSEQSYYSNVSSFYIGGSTGSIFSDMSFFGFNVGGGADMKIDTKTVQEDEDEWEVTFDLVQLPLIRGWFRFDLLSSTSWFWNKNATMHGKYISVGHIPLVSPENALMPVYPTSVLLIRNIQIKTKTKNLMETIATFKDTVDVHVGWGPFNLGSIRQDANNTSNYNHVTVDENGLKSDGVAIIGFVCDVIKNKLPSGSPE